MDEIADIQKITQFLANMRAENDLEAANSNNVEQLENESPDNDVDSDGILDNDAKTIIELCNDELLKKALICNVKNRHVLRKILLQLQSYLSELDSTIETYHKQQTKRCKEKQLSERNRPRRYRLGIPYFKDQHLFPSPQNEDCKKMKENSQLVLSSFSYNLWTNDDKNILSKAVYEQARNLEIKKIEKTDEARLKLFRNNVFIRQLIETWFTNTLDPTLLFKRKTELKLQLDEMSESTSGTSQKYHSLKCDVDHFDDKQTIIEAISECENVDWFQISADNFKERHDETECKAMWTCYMNPKYNKEPWTEEENDTLRDIAEAHDYQNWDAIALELNKSKSAYQCCIHFYSKLCDKFNKNQWTAKEDARLLEIVDMCRIGDHIAWAKVAYYFKNRTRMQLYNRYKYCLAPAIKKGPFSLAEDILLLTAVQLYGTHFPKVKELLPNRTTIQLRQRYCTIHTDDSQEWTLKDDIDIIRHVQKHGSKKWNLLESSRNQSCSRHRYITLKKWFHLNPDDSLQDVMRRRKEVYNRRSTKRKNAITNITSQLMSQLKRTKDHRNLLTVKHVEELLSALPGYISRRKIIRKRKLESSNLDKALLDFFKPTYKHLGRTKILTDDMVEKAADRVTSILQILKANLVLPGIEELEEHPELDNNDKRLLTQMIASSNASPPSSVELIPPNAETIVGFRNLLLHHPTLQMHSKGVYEHNELLDSLALPMSRTRGYKFLARQRDKEMKSLDDKLNKEVLKEQKLFSDRFFSLFWWPYLLSQEPPIKDTTFESDSDESESQLEPVRKRGRPKKFFPKIELMNKRKLEKRLIIDGTQPSTSNNTNEEYMSDNKPSKKPRVN